MFICSPGFSGISNYIIILRSKIACALNMTLYDSSTTEDYSIDYYDPDATVRDVITAKVTDTSKRENLDDSFHVVDLSKVAAQFERWRKGLPRVHPLYAMKCNPDPLILRSLANFGAGFDCGSKIEMRRALDIGVSPSNIIYANTCKQESHVRFAKANDVSLMTFDNEDELIKIKNVYPDAKLVLRLAPDDSSSLVKLSCKYGCHMDEVPGLLETAHQLNLHVAGVCFHVGSICQDPESFVEPIKAARRVFDDARHLGFEMDVLDIGGGFPGDLFQRQDQPFEEFADVINRELDKYFPAESHPGLRIVAEPGRYFAGLSYTAVLNVIARKEVKPMPTNGRVLNSENNEAEYKYYLNDGVYGSFLNITNKNITLIPSVLKERDDKEPTYTCSIWGQTCNGRDIITKQCRLPKLEVGEWLFFEAIGAYSIASASAFNGFNILPRYYVASKCHRSLFQKIIILP